MISLADPPILLSYIHLSLLPTSFPGSSSQCLWAALGRAAPPPYGSPAPVRGANRRQPPNALLLLQKAAGERCTVIP